MSNAKKLKIKTLGLLTEPDHPQFSLSIAPTAKIERGIRKGIRLIWSCLGLQDIKV